MALTAPRTSFENPVQREALPREPLLLKWPVLDRPRKSFFYTTFLGLVLISLAPLLLRLSIPLALSALGSLGFAAIMLMMICFMVFLKFCEQFKPLQWCYLLSVLLSLFLLLVPVREVFLGASIGVFALIYFFRRHYVEFCSATPVPRVFAKRFLENQALPSGVQPIPIVIDFRDALSSWLAYNPRGHSLPGLWRSPAGPCWLRCALTVLVVALLASCVPHLFVDVYVATIENMISMPGLQAVLAHVMIVPTLLLTLFAGAHEILGRAGGLRRSATLARYWEELQEDLTNSPNTVERDSLLVGRVASDSSPILVPLKVFNQHVWVSGATGSGKTAKLMCLIEQLAYRGYSVACLDLKADSFELLHTLEEMANSASSPMQTWHFTDRHGWATQLCSPFGQSYWKGLGPSERTNVHLASMGLGFSRDFGESWFNDASYTVLDFVNRKYPNIGSYCELGEKLAYELAHAQSHELSRSVKKDGEHASLIVRRLAHVEMFNPSANHPQTALDASLDFGSLFQTQCVAYWGLNSLMAAITSAEIARVVLGSILAAATNQKHRKRNLVLIIDEFQQMVAPGVLQLALRQARSLGISIILSNQTVDDLKTHKNDFVPTVEGNTATQLWLKGAGRDAIDQIQRLGGKYIDRLESRSVNSQGVSSVSTQEVLVDRFDATTIAQSSSESGAFLIRITDSAGYAHYNGIPFKARSEFHLDYADYQKRASAPWPTLSPESVVVGGGSPPNNPPAGSACVNNPSSPTPSIASNVASRIIKGSRRIGGGTLGGP